jgi:hypothetical protein
MRFITRKYDIEDAELAESEIRRRFDASEILPGGMSIIEVSPDLRPDEPTATFQHQQKSLQRRILTDRAEYRIRLAKAQQEGEIKRLEKKFELDLIQAEVDSQTGSRMDADEILRRHAARHPEDTEGIMKLQQQNRRELMQQQQQYYNSSEKLFRLMLRRGLIEADDIKPLLETTISNLGAPPHSTEPGHTEPPPSKFDNLELYGDGKKDGIEKLTGDTEDAPESREIDTEEE